MNCFQNNTIIDEKLLKIEEKIDYLAFLLQVIIAVGIAYLLLILYLLIKVK